MELIRGLLGPARRPPYPRRRGIFLAGTAVCVPWAVFITILFVLPNLRAVFAEIDAPLPGVTQLILSPGFLPVLLLIYGIEVIGLLVCRQVEGLRRFSSVIAGLAVVFWGAIVLALLLGIVQPLMNAGERL